MKASATTSSVIMEQLKIFSETISEFIFQLIERLQTRGILDVRFCMLNHLKIMEVVSFSWFSLENCLIVDFKLNS